MPIVTWHDGVKPITSGTPLTSSRPNQPATRSEGAEPGGAGLVESLAEDRCESRVGASPTVASRKKCETFGQAVDLDEVADERAGNGVTFPRVPESKPAMSEVSVAVLATLLATRSTGWPCHRPRSPSATASPSWKNGPGSPRP